MEHLVLVLLCLNSLLLVSLAIQLRPVKVSPRVSRRERLAEVACDYAEQVGKKGEKLPHALEAFRRLDIADNGRRDYNDAEARIAIESVLARRRR